MTVQETKEVQGYRKRPQQCNNCSHYKCDLIEVPGRWCLIKFVEKNKRCGIGGFAVQSSASCLLYTRKA